MADRASRVRLRVCLCGSFDAPSLPVWLSSGEDKRLGVSFRHPPAPLWRAESRATSPSVCDPSFLAIAESGWGYERVACRNDTLGARVMCAQCGHSRRSVPVTNTATHCRAHLAHTTTACVQPRRFTLSRVFTEVHALSCSAVMQTQASEASADATIPVNVSV